MLLFLLILTSFGGGQELDRKLESPQRATDIIPFRPFAFNLSMSSKYSMGKRDFEMIPAMTADYRFMHSRYRIGLSYAHNLKTTDNSISTSFNVKVFELGRPR